MQTFETLLQKKSLPPIQRKSGTHANYHKDNRTITVIQKKPETVTTEPVIQRAIVTDLVPDVQLSEKNRAKLDEVKKYMDSSLSKIKSKITTIYLNVVERKGTNPASTKLNNPGTAIILSFSDWFVRSASVGDICGMISHEIGVHTLGSNQMTEEEKKEETKHQKNPFSVSVGLHTHTITSWDDDKTSRQRDHINVGRDKGNNMVPLRQSKSKRKKVRGKRQKRDKNDVDSVNARALKYAQTTLRIGDAIETDNIPQKEKDQRLHDLLNSILFDYARIIATDDVAWHVADKTPMVAQVFNWYKNVFIKRYGEKHTWLQRKSMLPTASTWGLRAYLTQKVAMVYSAKILPERVHDTIDTVMTKGGELVSGVGNYLGSKSSTLSTIGSGVGKVLRGVDYVYGEVENLVVPKVVAPIAWGVGKLKTGIKGLRGYVGL